MNKTVIGIFAAIMAMAESSPNFSSGLSNYKCSINEITEKTNVTEEEILELLEKGIIRGKVIFRVPFIIDDTPWSVRRKLEKYRGGE